MIADQNQRFDVRAERGQQMTLKHFARLLDEQNARPQRVQQTSLLRRARRRHADDFGVAQRSQIGLLFDDV